MYFDPPEGHVCFAEIHPGHKIYTSDIEDMLTELGKLQIKDYSIIKSVPAPEAFYLKPNFVLKIHVGPYT